MPVDPRVVICVYFRPVVAVAGFDRGVNPFEDPAPTHVDQGTHEIVRLRKLRLRHTFASSWKEAKTISDASEPDFRLVRGQCKRFPDEDIYKLEIRARHEVVNDQFDDDTW